MVKKATGRAPNIVSCILRGIGAAAAITLLGAVAVAKLVDGEVMPRESIGYGAMAVLLVASFLGAKLGKQGAGHQAMKTGIGAGIGYFLALLAVNFLFFGGSFSGMGISLLLILLGTGLAVLPMGQGRGTRGRKRYKIPK